VAFGVFARSLWGRVINPGKSLDYIFRLHKAASYAAKSCSSRNLTPEYRLETVQYLIFQDFTDANGK
jgi:hypothetical protein